MTLTLRIHPAIGISRSGNAPDSYVIAPETSAGMPVSSSTPNPNEICGGLPTKQGTTDYSPVSDQDLRDSQGRLKPHAQRFRIYAYDTPPNGVYPYQGITTEVTLGATIGGKTVTKIIWQAHMANKKANNWIIPEDPSDNKDWNNGVGGLAHYADNATPNTRNGNFGTSTNPLPKDPYKSGHGEPLSIDEMNDETRRSYLVLDAGPKTLQAESGGAFGADTRVNFDSSACSYTQSDGSVETVDYPTQFPGDKFQNLDTPNDTTLESLGAMETDADGRLYVIGSPGYAAGWNVNENNPGGTVDNGTDEAFPLNNDIDNDGWFDDACDGPISATVFFDDDSSQQIDVPAWVVCADPSFAPQVRNVVSIWDEVYNSWLRQPSLALAPELCTPGDANNDGDGATYNDSYQPFFLEDVWTTFRAAHLQMFSTDLNAKAIGAHQRINNITAESDPQTFLNLKSFIRNPNTGADNELGTGTPLMPLALGDTGASFLTVTHTQYFFLEQWFAGKAVPTGTTLTAGELIDKNTLTNLLGGRFSPGIDLTFVVRDPYLYNQDWQNPDVGPFRIGAKGLDYSTASTNTPFLSVGYVPNRQNQNSVEPGDLCKFMALPWHTDYNSCATHTPSPDPKNNTTLFWSWPAQRPVSVYTYSDYQNNDNEFVSQQHFSVRGAGTQWEAGSPDPEYANGPSSVGRYQERMDMLTNWFNIGTSMQGQAIEGFVEDPKNPELFLEVQSLLDGPSDWSQPWPILTTDKVYTEAEAEGD